MKACLKNVVNMSTSGWAKTKKSSSSISKSQGDRQDAPQPRDSHRVPRNRCRAASGILSEGRQFVDTVGGLRAKSRAPFEILISMPIHFSVGSMNLYAWLIKSSVFFTSRQ
jgi:hypothetical protein